MLKLRILLADDHDVVRQGTRLLLEKRGGWEVCGEARTGREAVELTEKLCPDVVVTDINMPELNGLEVIRQVKRVLPDTEILVFTGAETEHVIRAAFQNGARGFLLKSEIATQLISAVESLAQRQPVYNSRVAKIIFDGYADLSRAPSPEQSGVLTARERETVQLLAEGKSNKDVANAFGIAVKTVEAHRAALMRKLGLTSLADLVRYAIRNQIIEP
ncbi:MAG TPA: response regulator transcription factor [Chthoniobacterales bacterium]|nr:response regulator transcription factor [Chthoniobacterales bacterium]